MSKDKLMYPSEILKTYPELEEVWTANDLGYFLKTQLVKGKKLQRSCLLSRNDVLKLFRYYKKKNEGEDL